MLTVGVKHNIADTVKFLDDKFRKQVPFATAKALTRIAQLGKVAVVKEMNAKFDKPTPFTLRSTFIKPATKLKLESSVNLKDDPVGGNPYALSEILAQEYSGGSRIRKRIELFFQRAGYISSSEYLAPGKAAKLDRYGNMNRGQVQQILSQLKAGPDKYAHSSNSSRSKASVKKAGVMFWSRGGHLARGVWMRVAGGVKPILIVISRPQYKQRINLPQIMSRVIDANFDKEFSKALDEAVGTAR